MKHTIEIDCPPEILMGLHLDAVKFADLIKLQSATACLMDNNEDDFAFGKFAIGQISADPQRVALTSIV